MTVDNQRTEVVGMGIIESASGKETRWSDNGDEEISYKTVQVKITE